VASFERIVKPVNSAPAGDQVTLTSDAPQGPKGSLELIEHALRTSATADRPAGRFATQPTSPVARLVAPK
jgi:hypothetical protein